MIVLLLLATARQLSWYLYTQLYLVRNNTCRLKVKRESERQAELWLRELLNFKPDHCPWLPGTRVESQEERLVCAVLGWSIMGTPSAQFRYQLKAPLIYFFLSEFSPCLSSCWCWGLLLVGFVCLFVFGGVNFRYSSGWP